MWYNVYIKTNTNTTPKCFQCGSSLIVVSKITEKKEGSLFPQTAIIYRCSNKPCQEETDIQTAKRIKIRDDRKLEDDKRVEKKLQEKKEGKKLQKGGK